MPLEMYSIISFPRGFRESFPALNHISHSNILSKKYCSPKSFSNVLANITVREINECSCLWKRNVLFFY